MSMQLSRRQTVTSNLSACDTAITPDCLRALYNFTQPTSAQANNSLGIFTAAGNHYAQEDLDMFFANYSSNIPPGTHPIPDLINGAQGPTTVDQASTEADLDFEVAYPIVYPQNLTLYQLGGSFNSFLDAIDGVNICLSFLSPFFPLSLTPNNKKPIHRRPEFLLTYSLTGSHTVVFVRTANAEMPPLIRHLAEM